jgi:hypothetical protein
VALGRQSDNSLFFYANKKTANEKMTPETLYQAFQEVNQPLKASGSGYSDNVLKSMAGIIADCLNVDPEKRPTADKVYERWMDEVYIPMTDQDLPKVKEGSPTGDPNQNKTDSNTGPYKHPAYGLSKKAQLEIDQAKQNNFLVSVSPHILNNPQQFQQNSQFSYNSPQGNPNSPQGNPNSQQGYPQQPSPPNPYN